MYMYGNKSDWFKYGVIRNLKHNVLTQAYMMHVSFQAWFELQGFLLAEYIRGAVNMGVIGIENKIRCICTYIWFDAVGREKLCWIKMNKYKLHLKGVLSNSGKN